MVPPTVADVSGLLRVLAEHDVSFLVVGGVCAVIHGAPVSTFDLDIVPERSDDNVRRLLRALASVDAVHRDLAGRSIPLDVLGTIGEGRDFASMAPCSRTIALGDGLTARVLDLEALIEVKREAGREKDLATLPILVRTLEERRRREG